jgi:hypothetical protein
MLGRWGNGNIGTCECGIAAKAGGGNAAKVSWCGASGTVEAAWIVEAAKLVQRTLEAATAVEELDLPRRTTMQ